MLMTMKLDLASVEVGDHRFLEIENLRVVNQREHDTQSVLRRSSTQ